MPAADCVAATAAALQVLAGADAVMGFQNQCGLSRTMQLRCQYTDDGRLWETNKYGVYEVFAHKLLLYLILLIISSLSSSKFRHVPLAAHMLGEEGRVVGGGFPV